MTDIDQAKAMARRLRAALEKGDITLNHAAALELVAAQLGYDDWNTASARLDPVPEAIRFLRTVPILRIFDEAKAREFYGDFLGFSVVFEHRFEPNMPLYMEVARAGLALHLSEHHGDASPGSTVFVPMQGVHAYQRELIAKRYNYGRPGVESQPWGDVLQVHDPFGNRIRFCQMRDSQG
ncbi:glyoxalase superfamily protein [Dyella sp.]|uniref:glyoxalase superfamily protein n=1 Tax=Dyella sp. TaxID=1869338 RepID=UPI002ED61AD9